MTDAPARGAFIVVAPHNRYGFTNGVRYVGRVTETDGRLCVQLTPHGSHYVFSHDELDGTIADATVDELAEATIRVDDREDHSTLTGFPGEDEAIAREKAAWRRAIGFAHLVGERGAV